MASDPTSTLRVRVDGKFFRLGEEKFFPKGVSYGPFAPNASGEPLPSPEQVEKDFTLVRQLGANLVRVYHAPPRWFLDLAAKQDMKVLVDISWSKHRCFLDSKTMQAEAQRAVTDAVLAGAHHSAVFAYSVANEIPPDVVRWSGADAVADFIDELVLSAKAIDAQCLCTFGNFPPTEFLRAHAIDFHCFNVYLHDRKQFENYLARLQMVADHKPLILGEFGIDSLREGENRKCEILTWQIESAFQHGLAGTCAFSFTDDWYREGRQIEDWAFGLTTRDRQPKDSFEVVRKQYAVAPHFPLPRQPKVSVVVASYNGARTLDACLESLTLQNYPNYEIILVDDGSTDTTPEIAARYPSICYVRREQNRGLSAARNIGIASAAGEVVAFTDADCRADEDWLYYLVGDLLRSDFAGIGGHNFLPPEDSWVAAAVMASPGGPAHVMLTDRVAEHVPGCNMAFYQWALEEVGGFDPRFRLAGDDVDICWRLQQRGLQIGFSSGGFVWHYRRASVADYLEQQRGYGEAEALLAAKHAEYFNAVGASIWRGRIYTASKAGIVVRPPRVYHGLFGSGMFQTLYTAEPALPLMLATTLEYHVLVTLPLLVIAVGAPFLWPLVVTSLLISFSVCMVAAAQAEIPSGRRRFWSRPLVALLFFLQPIVRGGARYRGRLSVRPMPSIALQRSKAARVGSVMNEIPFWAPSGFDRLGFLEAVVKRLDEEGWHNRTDAGWSDYDVEIYGGRWSCLQLVTVAEQMQRDEKLIRCRLRAEWSLFANVTFWSMLGVELLLIGFGGPIWPWLWMILLTLPLFGWFLEQEKRTLQRLVMAFLRDVAGRLRLQEIRENESERTVATVKTDWLAK